MVKALKAVSYLRVSGKGQVDGDGFPRQREAIEHYAKNAGVELVGEYRDEGVSGAKELEDREGLSELLARIRSNGVRVVIVERADRIARDLLVSEVILGQFRDLGVKVIAADGGTDLTAGDDDPTRVLIRQVLGAVAQFEKAVIVSKLKAARQRKKRATGRCEGRKPYGWRPGEAEVVAYIAKLRRKPKGAKRQSFRVIADRLNAEGVPTRTGRAWAGETVRGIAMRR
jgi:DNA invertase Pin-like site-specific DNA recombinase